MEQRLSGPETGREPLAYSGLGCAFVIILLPEEISKYSTRERVIRSGIMRRNSDCSIIASVPSAIIEVGPRRQKIEEFAGLDETGGLPSPVDIRKFHIDCGWEIVLQIVLHYCKNLRWSRGLRVLSRLP
jgi:hypothetical protein